MRPVAVVVLDVLVHHGFEVTSAEEALLHWAGTVALSRTALRKASGEPVFRD